MPSQAGRGAICKIDNPMQYLRLIFIPNGAILHHWLAYRTRCQQTPALMRRSRLMSPKGLAAGLQLQISLPLWLISDLP
jgi:hypothetical protein